MRCIGLSDYNIYTDSQLQKMCTRQLLKHLRDTYSWGCPYCWKEEDWKDLREYKKKIKAVLATREHIPNKKESKAIRKAKIKKGV